MPGAKGRRHKAKKGGVRQRKGAEAVKERRVQDLEARRQMKRDQRAAHRIRSMRGQGRIGDGR